MRRIIFALLAGATALGIAWYLAGIPGKVSADIGAYTFEASSPVVLLGLALLFIVLYVVVRVLGLILRLPSVLREGRRTRHRVLGDEAVTRTLVALASDAKAEARREASRARYFLGDTPQTLLLVAEAGRLSGRDDEVEAAFRALSARSDSAFLGFRGLLREAVARKDWNEAAALARRAEAANPGAVWLRQERGQLAIRAGNWVEAALLAESASARAALGTAAADAEPDPTKARAMAHQAWKQDRSLCTAALAYAERLRAANREKRATSVIVDSWKIAPHPSLASFVLRPVSDPLARVRLAQRLANANPGHPESHLLMARVSLDAGLTGEARHHLDAVQHSGLNERRMWRLIADMEEQERGQTEEGRSAQRTALRRASDADSDPVWRCSSCHSEAKDWSPACPYCVTAGGLRWGRPIVRPLLMVADTEPDPV